MSVGESEKETARQSRSLSISQKVRIKSEKKSSRIDRGRHGVKNLRTGLRVWGICDIHRERKERAKLKRKNGIYLSGDLKLTFQEVMVLKNRERNINPLMSLLFFKLWPTEHKCIANQFNPVTTLRFHMMCGWQQCQAHTRVSVAWSPGQGKSPDLRGILTWQGHTSNGILTSGSEAIEIFPTASYTHFNLLLLYYPHSNEGSFLLFFDLSSVTFCWWTGSVPWVVGHKLTENVKTGVLAFKTHTHIAPVYLIAWNNAAVDDWYRYFEILYDFRAQLQAYTPIIMYTHNNVIHPMQTYFK